MLSDVFKEKITINKNFIEVKSSAEDNNQQHTNEAFSEKWTEYEKTNEKEKLYNFQKEWYLKLYGFESEDELAKLK